MRQLIFPAALLSVLAMGCSSSKTAQPTAQAKQPAIETIGGQPISVSEFTYVYNKNNANAENAYSQQSLNEYLDLYTNFKLKVVEAEKRGLDTTAAFRKELEGYKQQLAQPYLTEKSVTEQLVKEAYERMKKEVNASHILIAVSPDADPKDTLAAYNKIVQLRERALKGEDFGKLAKQNSDDPSAKENNGNLGYFTALQMVYPFESAAYNTQPGQISKPVRTKFGYHILKVNNVRPAQGEIKVSHIMVRATPGQPAEDSLAAKKKIDEIYSLLQKGEKWEKLVSQFSEDASSVSSGGELPWFGTGRMIPVFEEAAFALKNPNDYTAPVKTPYGWHIIKLNERRSLPAFTEMEPTLKAKVAKDSRSDLNKTAFLKRIRKENNFVEYAPAQQVAFANLDSSIVKGTWTGKDTDKKRLAVPMFKINDRMYTVGDFYAYVKANQRARKGGSPASVMRSYYDRFVDESLLNYERAHLEDKYVDYRMLVKEYRDGILLFQLMDEKVWSKAIQDTAGMRTYFNANRDKYKWDTRAEAIVISAANRQVLDQALAQMKKGRYEYRKEKADDVRFAANSATLSKEAQASLDKLVTLMKNDSSLVADVTGAVSGTEAAAKKAALAQQRATAVATYLNGKGIAGSRINAKAVPAVGVNKVESEATAKEKRKASISLFSTSLNTLADYMNQTNPLALQVTPARKYQKGENKLLDEVQNWQKGTQTFDKDGRAVYVEILRVLPPGPKSLNEARGLVTSDYQNYLEKQWLEELRKTYPVQVNQQELQKLVKKQ